MTRKKPARIIVPLTCGAFALGFACGLFSAEPTAPVLHAATGQRPAAPAGSALVEQATGEPMKAGPAMVAPAALEPAAPAPLAVATASAAAGARQAMAAVVAPAAKTPPAAPRPSLSQAALSAPAARVDKAALDRRASVERVVVRPGDTLARILTRARIGRDQAHAAITSLSEQYDPRQLRTGQALQIAATAQPAAGENAPQQLVSLTLALDFDHQLLVTRDASGSFATSKVERPQQRQLVWRAGPIDDSLYLSAEREAVPANVIAGLIKLFSWDVDFQRDIRAGDRFELLYDQVTLTGETAVRGDEPLFAGLELSGEPVSAYRYSPADGSAGYYDPSGRSLRKFLLRTPIDGARLSSTFGPRKHPILGYNLMHKGVDFAAPTGTPIYAAGSGKVEFAGRNGGFGNYVRLRHSNEYQTAYAHLSKFAAGIKPGVRVRQGQVIAYVGTTGRSTGPHLHYEVLRNDAQINPLKLKQQAATQLAGAELEQFRAEMARIDALRKSHAAGTQLASHSTQ